MEPAACSNCSAKLRCAGVGLKSYLSSGKSSAMAMSLRPTSFQESSTTFNSGSAGLTAASFFIASWAWAGNANASRAIARNDIVFISFSTIEFRNQSFSLLFRLCQLRDNLSNFIEYLVHALQLTAIFCALHGFISNEGEFRPAGMKADSPPLAAPIQTTEKVHSVHAVLAGMSRKEGKEPNLAIIHTLQR